MAHNISDKMLDEHVQLTDNMVNRLDNLYRQICEYEQIFNTENETDDALSLIQLLENIRDIHKAAKMLHPAKDNLTANIQDLQQQMSLLESSFDLLLLQNDGETKDESDENNKRPANK